MAAPLRDLEAGRVFLEPAEVTADRTFSLEQAFRLGVLGEREPLATTSGVESMSCCHSLIATG